MTTKEMIAVMQAFEDGKKIQARMLGRNDWWDCKNPSWAWSTYEYRIKPEVKHKYKVGDYVRVLDGSNIPDYTCSWALEMKGAINRIYQIEELVMYGGKPCYFLKSINFCFDERGLALVKGIGGEE